MAYLHQMHWLRFITFIKMSKKKMSKDINFVTLCDIKYAYDESDGYRMRPNIIAC